jgi:hypothetical protein
VAGLLVALAVRNFALAIAAVISYLAIIFGPRFFCGFPSSLLVYLSGWRASSQPSPVIRSGHRVSLNESESHL